MAYLNFHSLLVPFLSYVDFHHYEYPPLACRLSHIKNKRSSQSYIENTCSFQRRQKFWKANFRLRIVRCDAFQVRNRQEKLDASFHFIKTEIGLSVQVQAQWYCYNVFLVPFFWYEYATQICDLGNQWIGFSKIIERTYIVIAPSLFLALSFYI